MYLDYAHNWRTFNSAEYEKAAEKKMAAMAADFADGHSVLTAAEAAKVITSEKIARHVVDEEVRREYYSRSPVELFQASCWSVRHQGVYRAALDKVEVEHAQEAKKQWKELRSNTEVRIYALSNKVFESLIVSLV